MKAIRFWQGTKGGLAIAAALLAFPLHTQADINVSSITGHDWGYFNFGGPPNDPNAATIGQFQINGPYSSGPLSASGSETEDTSGPPGYPPTDVGACSIYLGPYASTYNSTSVSMSISYSLVSYSRGKGYAYVDAELYSDSSCVFNVSSPQFFSFTGTQTDAAYGYPITLGDSTSNTALSTQSSLYELPSGNIFQSSISGSGILLPGHQYYVSTGNESDFSGGLSAFAGDTFNFSSLLKTAPYSATGSGLVSTVIVPLSSPYPNNKTTVGNVTITPLNSVSNASMTVSYISQISASDLASASSPLGEAAGPATFELAGANDTTEAWDLSISDGQLTGDTTLTFTYDPATLGPGVTDDSLLRIYHYTDGAWVIPAGETVDTQNDTITLTVDSFSPFALGVAAVPEPSSVLMGVFAIGLLAGRRPARFSQNKL